MATGLEPAAGIVGIVGVSYQVAQSLFKIRAFCKDVREAPADLQKLTASLENVSRILIRLDEAVRSSPASTLNTNGDILRSSLRGCYDATAEISTFVSNVHQKLSKRKYRTSCSLVLKRREIKMMLENLDRSKADLALAFSMFASADAMEYRQELYRKGSSARTNPHKPAALGYFKDEEREQLGSGIVLSSIGPSLRFALPEWLCEYAWAIHWQRAAGRWTMSLTTFRRLDPGSGALMHCLNGDFESVRRLLEERRLSVHDECASGYSLYAVGYPARALLCCR